MAVADKTTFSSRQNEAEKLLGEIIVSLVIEKRFYFEVLNRVVKRFSSKVSNMGISLEDDEPVLTVNTDFFLAAGERERLALLEHEILHLLFRHPLRLGDRNPRFFGMACDMAINQLLEECPSGFMVPGRIFNEDEAEPLRDAEYYYALLAEKDDTCVEGETDDDHRQWEREDADSDSSPPEQRMLNQRGVERTLTGALKAAGGKLPHHLQGNIPLEIEESERPLQKSSWRLLLRRYLKACLFRRSITEVEVLLSKRRPHRKMGFPFPSLRAHPKRMLMVAVIVDVSGSISPERFGIFMMEVERIRKRDIMVNLIFSDTDICRVVEEKLDDEEVVQALQELNYCDGIIYNYGHEKFSTLELLLDRGCFRGRGGTGYSAAVSAAEKMSPRPDCTIYFTDSHDDGSLEAPSVPLIFVLTEKREKFYPWALCVMMDEKNS